MARDADVIASASAQGGEMARAKLGSEDCRHMSRWLDAELVRTGESVNRVSPKLIAGARRSGREPSKSDPIDALTGARAVLRWPDLPVATLDGP